MQTFWRSNCPQHFTLSFTYVTTNKRPGGHVAPLRRDYDMTRAYGWSMCPYWIASKVSLTRWNTGWGCFIVGMWMFSSKKAILLIGLMTTAVPAPNISSNCKKIYQFRTNLIISKSLCGALGYIYGICDKIENLAIKIRDPLINSLKYSTIHSLTLTLTFKVQPKLES